MLTEIFRLEAIFLNFLGLNPTTAPPLEIRLGLLPGTTCYFARAGSDFWNKSLHVMMKLEGNLPSRNSQPTAGAGPSTLTRRAEGNPGIMTKGMVKS